jgi:hypothetical protein
MESQSNNNDRKVEDLEIAVRNLEAENMALKTRQDELQKSFIRLRKDVIIANRYKIEEAVGTKALERAYGKEQLEKMRNAEDYP